MKNINIVHVCNSYNEQCGISNFATKIDEYFKLDDNINVEQVNSLPIKKQCDYFIYEYEHGILNTSDYKNILQHKDIYNKSIIIQHSFTEDQNNTNIYNKLYSIFDKIIYMSKDGYLSAVNLYPKYAYKMHYISHYMFDIADKTHNNTNDIVIGTHGYSLDRNMIDSIMYNIINIINKFDGTNKNIKGYIHASLNDSKCTYVESSQNIDKLRRIWLECSQYLRNSMRIDITYYDNIVEKLSKECDILLFAGVAQNGFYNASGSVRTLLSTGLPVFAVESSLVSDIECDSLIKCTNIIDLQNKVIDYISTTDVKDNKYKIYEISKSYIKNNDIEHFINRLLK